jgi:hypothetical protein
VGSEVPFGAAGEAGFDAGGLEVDPVLAPFSPEAETVMGARNPNVTTNSERKGRRRIMRNTIADI